MKIALAQLNYLIGDFEKNTKNIIDAIKTAEQQGADIVVFGELSICGYPARDFLEFNDFLERCHNSILSIASHCTNIAAVVGGPQINPKKAGKNIFNAAYFLADGEIKHIYQKALLPTYDIFDEYRYFEPGKQFECVKYKGKTIALTICEDIWDLENDPLYNFNPMDILIKEKPDVVLNISGSPFSYTHAEARIAMLKKNAAKYNIPIVYVNHVGAQTEIIFDGGSMVCSAKGNIVSQLPYFEKSIQTLPIFNIGETDIKPSSTKIERIHKALVLGIKEYFEKLGFKKAIMGLSGGIDSALTCALATEALGKENVLGVLMPSQYSSEHSIADAFKLGENLGIKTIKLPIENVFTSFENTLKEQFEGCEENVTEENIQARTRGTLLMAMSNKFGHILLNTSNKSEIAVGYGTLYGDLCGGLSVLGDVYKTEVWELSNYINRNQELIPKNSITKPPSAELRPNQKDSDSLPDYEVLDKILFMYIEKQQSPDEIKAVVNNNALVDRILKLVNISEYKRHQTAPVLRVSNKAFGMGRRMPLVAKYLS